MIADQYSSQSVNNLLTDLVPLAHTGECVCRHLDSWNESSSPDTYRLPSGKVLLLSNIPRHRELQQETLGV